ncbi:hypothetical protein SETIT_5G169000v2 [Setaria italica]|uniref:Uncharacterized protein n=1 Tax=Setaria italica TaxID=4555 RepID=A0A368R5J1_SETIT|nr:hypothetical protein SETIT_5G169000v2 [Setaria italica]
MLAVIHNRLNDGLHVFLKFIHLQEQVVFVIIHELLFIIRWPDLKAITEKYEHPKTMVSPQDIPSSFFEDCNK